MKTTLDKTIEHLPNTLINDHAKLRKVTTNQIEKIECNHNKKISHVWHKKVKKALSSILGKLRVDEDWESKRSDEKECVEKIKNFKC